MVWTLYILFKTFSFQKIIWKTRFITYKAYIYTFIATLTTKARLPLTIKPSLICGFIAFIVALFMWKQHKISFRGNLSRVFFKRNNIELINYIHRQCKEATTNILDAKNIMSNPKILHLGLRAGRKRICDCVRYGSEGQKVSQSDPQH